MSTGIYFEVALGLAALFVLWFAAYVVSKM